MLLVFFRTLVMLPKILYLFHLCLMEVPLKEGLLSVLFIPASFVPTTLHHITGRMLNIC